MLLNLDPFEVVSFKPVISQDLGVFSIYYLIALLIFLIIYIYVSSAYQNIGKKSKIVGSGIAWFPILGPLIIIYQSSKLHWWPFIFSFLSFFILLIFYPIYFNSQNIIIIYMLLSLLIITLSTFFIMIMVWHWQTYKNLKKSGFLLLIPFIIFLLGLLFKYKYGVENQFFSVFGIVFIVIGIILHLIFIGILGFKVNSYNN